MNYEVLAINRGAGCASTWLCRRCKSSRGETHFDYPTAEAAVNAANVLLVAGHHACFHSASRPPPSDAITLLFSR